LISVPAVLLRLLTIGLLSAIAGAGAFAQSLVPSSIYTMPQRLVAVDGARRLNLYCIGSGEPTVVLEAGAGNSMMTWRHVQAEIAGFARVCAYDRAGLGYSDAATRPSSIANIVDDLHRLIAAAGITTPVVFVGHSLGGEAGLLFISTYRGGGRRRAGRSRLPRHAWPVAGGAAAPEPDNVAGRLSQDA
jgi:pimeloyl-ACP methyl ester carboxylesterase